MKYIYLFLWISGNSTNNNCFNENDEFVENGDTVIQSSPSDSLFFVYQSSWMKRLLKTYGNEICLLDATYKTTRCALPLFFMFVKTNMDYYISIKDTEILEPGLESFA